MALTGLNLVEYSDRELLSVLLKEEEVASDPKGWVTSIELAESIGLQRLKGAQCVGQRLGWLRRYGMVEHEKPGKWKLTKVGKAFANGSLRAAERKALEGVDDMHALEAVSALASSYRRLGPSAAFLARRAWRHGTYVPRPN